MKRKHSTNYTILLLGIAILAIIISSCGASKNYKTSPCWKGAEPRHRYGKMRAAILKQNTDERGLISVIYVDNNDKDTFAFDYLTMVEFDSIFIAKN